MSRVLVTGADGFLGKKVIELLIKHDLPFIGVSRKRAKNNHVLCDLSKPADVLNLLEKTKPKVVINLAASVDFKTTKLDSLFSVNVMLPSVLGSYCQESKSYLIHSSGTIVHGSSHELFNIDTELAPDTGYGKSKLLADDKIRACGCEHTILRLGGIFGRNGPSHLGINKAISDALRGKPPSVIGSGNAIRNYIFVEDAAEAIVGCVDVGITGIHYLGGESKTIRGMLYDICEVFIPGEKPTEIDGEEGIDQIVENSPYFNTTPFKTALKRIL